MGKISGFDSLMDLLGLLYDRTDFLIDQNVEYH